MFVLLRDYYYYPIQFLKRGCLKDIGNDSILQGRRELMNKTEFVNKIAEAANISKAAAAKAVESFQECVAETLEAGENVTLTGFGTFAVADRAARTGRNPQTGEAIQIPAKKVVKFKVGKNLKDRVK